MSIGLNEQLTERRKQAITSAVDNVSMRFIKSAMGAKLIDVDGREYIDLAGGIAVMNVGHRHPKNVAAIKKQAEKYYTPALWLIPINPS